MREILDIVELEQLEAKKISDNRMQIRGLCQRADVPNKNKRIYTGEVLRREVDRMLPEVKSGGMLMLSGHPKKGESPEPEDVTARLDNLNWKGNELFFQATVLNTQAGKNLQELVKSGCKVGISSRGIGEVTPKMVGGQEVKFVNPDYKLVSFDFVIGGSVPGAQVTQVVEWCENDDADRGTDEKPLSEEEKVQLKAALGRLSKDELALLDRWFDNDFVPEVIDTVVKEMGKQGEEKELSPEEVQSAALDLVAEHLGDDAHEELLKSITSKAELELQRERNEQLTEDQKRQIRLCQD